MKLNCWYLAEQLDGTPFDPVLHRAYLDAHREDYGSTDSEARRALRGIVRVHYDARSCAEAWCLLHRENAARWVCLMLCAERCPRRFRAFCTVYVCPGFATPLMQSMPDHPDHPWGAYLWPNGQMGDTRDWNRPRPRDIKITVGAKWLLREYRDDWRSGSGRALVRTNVTGRLNG